MTVSGLIMSLCFAAIFLIFINGEIGWLMIYILIGAAFVSFVVCFFSRKHFSVSAEEFSGLVRADSECTVVLTIAKKGLCFLPFITVEGMFAGQKFAVRTSLLFRNSTRAEVKVVLDECGLQRAHITRTVVGDFTGLFRFKRTWDVSTTAAVLPRETEYVGPEVIPSMLPSEDEDREEGATVSFGGTPGYEHRPYIEGDSPRRINYKLSAKKQQLMVRLDESSGTESTNIVLSADADGSCAEQAYALAAKLVNGGSPAAVYHLGESCSAATPASLSKLREWIAFRDLHTEGGETLMPAGRVCVLISPQGISVA